MDRNFSGKPVLLLLAFSLLFAELVSAQCTQTSTDGYTVSMTVSATSIIPSSNSCPFGYNYNLQISYDVSFSGSNIPASLYTLQGTITCGGDQHFFNLPNSGGSGTVTSGSNPYRNAADCNTATPSSLNCTDVDIDISGSGISNTTVDCGSAVLPIELGGFSAVLEDDHVLINWVTLSEINNDYFTLERSADGINYEVLSIVSGAGYSKEIIEYEVVDRAPYPGPAHYRLRQTDFNGEEEMFGPILVEPEEQSKQIHAFLVSGSHTLEVVGATGNKHTLEVLSLQGLPLYQTSINSPVIALPDLPTATYLLRFTHRQTGAVHVQKLVLVSN